ncbi:hypothetical protein C4J88_3327 [Pseudomonas sp. R4-39-08]|uniref:hypothetical protein n=1 Tax=Pseudomonas sp. R4-39-08 TaxID=1173288 RepID=UPI000F564596|nr:hypothetical protein [Pseudomonas sp. R4-39-08]AZF38105.1 hypothetical protein C4J88_3327 [Pseudomonas sp. R4-39-08]
MSEIYIELDNMVPAPAIEPLHNGVIHYQDMVDGKGVLVINPFKGMAPGQQIHWRVRGDGTLLSDFEVTEVKQYTVSLNRRVFSIHEVTASYEVRLAGEPIFASLDAIYKVQGYPTK